MEKHIVKINRTFYVTHDVKCFRLEKPEGYSFVPGQATEVSINKPGWQEERRPFTFTSLPEDDYLEFTIKLYPSRRGVTNELHHTNLYHELILHEVFGAIQYKGEGVFIAGGAGITPFLAIFRKLNAEGKMGNNFLIFGNKTSHDIILQDELLKMLGSRFINVLSEEKSDAHEHGLISRELLEKYVYDFNQYFYVCGPDPMMDKVLEHLNGLGVKEKYIVHEAF
jgi:ferredoxin-NADP reductase